MTQALREFYRYRLAIIGTAVLVFASLCAVLAPVITPHDPNLQDIEGRLTPPGSIKTGERPHYLGTDQLGRDILSRVIYGTRVSLIVSSVSVFFALTLGTLVGLYAGYYGGVFDSLVMRLVELQMAFPFILLALVILSILGPSLSNIIILFAVTSWPSYARTVRGSVLARKETALVEAARAIGLRDSRILIKHVLANSISPVIVIASFDMGRMILMESALGFLGLGVQPPTPTWGNMLADGRDYIRSAWWLITFPGLGLMVTVLGINFIGDAARDYIDPRTRIEG
ncbi:MAG: ABC transporter permease [Armatimonadetes bacterium]|nr:ABC transporter permease [Armatimonadota bacterium]